MQYYPSEKSHATQYPNRQLAHGALTYLPESPSLVNEVRRVMRLIHVSRRIQASFLHYIVDLIPFESQRHPRALGVHEIRACLSYLTTEKDVTASTQTVAPSLQLPS
jgi:hypothetical protein